jgi:hypothetical protein
VGGCDVGAESDTLLPWILSNDERGHQFTICITLVEYQSRQQQIVRLQK